MQKQKENNNKNNNDNYDRKLGQKQKYFNDNFNEHEP